MNQGRALPINASVVSRTHPEQWCLDGAPIQVPKEGPKGGAVDRRTHTRIDLSRTPCPAIVRRIDSSAHAGAITNISSSGIWVQMAAPLSLSQQVKLKIRSQSVALERTGYVVRRSPRGMAIVIDNAENWLNESGLDQPLKPDVLPTFVVQALG